MLFAGASFVFARSIMQAKPEYLSNLEWGILNEMNLARTKPKIYADLLKAYRQGFQGRLLKRPGKIDLLTQEGVSAVDEAIRALGQQKPLGEMIVSRGMSRAAADHVKDTGPSGITGHTGQDGSTPFVRMERYGNWKSTAGENISYGNDEARAVVMQLIIDDGVSSRGHRKNIYNEKFNTIGIACGQHAKYKTMCVTTLAGGFEER